MKRQQRLARLVCSVIVVATVGAPVFAAQDAPAEKTWAWDASATFIASPGLGSTKALGVGTAFALVRSRHTDSGFGHECWGGVFHFDSLWDPTGGGLAEKWILAGPRWDRGDQEGTVFAHLLGGMKRVAGPTVAGHDGEPRSYAAIGAGAGMSIGLFLVEFDARVSPANEGSRYRLMFSAGATFGMPLKR